MWKRPDPDAFTVPSRAHAALWALLGLLSLAVAGCVSTPQLASEPTAAPGRARFDASLSGPRCAPCADQIREIERLRFEVASRDAELRELRSSQRDQVKVLQESKREVTRAKVKVRRLATRADAASYIAEVEVAMASVHSTGAKSSDPRIVQARHLLASTDAPFAQGDYGVAMDRAAEAEQLIISASDAATQRASLARGKTESRPAVKVSSRPTVDSNSRGPHPGNARNAGTQKRNTPSVASGDRRSWMQAGTESR